MGWRRLYVQIYFTIVASLAIVVVLFSLLWFFVGRDRIDRDMVDMAGRLAYVALPAADAPVDRQAAAVTRMGRELEIDLTLYDRERRVIAAAGPILALPDRGKAEAGWRWTRKGRIWVLKLPDGRWLTVDHRRHVGGHPLLGAIGFFAVVALGVALGAYPFVRRLTRRLERLQQGVESIGAGDLKTRVEVRGRDEVAGLAQSFNEAAEQIEKLVDAHRLLLANASHELRTPLSRIRMGIEMLPETGDPARRAALQQDIGELDALIDEILLMSRLDAGSHGDLSQEVDLVALAAEECARFADCALNGRAPDIRGDPRLLRRLIRNLLENADRHGAAPVTVEVSSSAEAVVLRVKDSGEGIAEAERARVFQPFYRAGSAQNTAGYGLGLPLARQIAEAHGGTIRLVPRAEAASAIEVTLPMRRTGAA